MLNGSRYILKVYCMISQNVSITVVVQMYEAVSDDVAPLMLCPL